MFTVVISEQEHIDNLRQFDIFLKPFTDNDQIVFCLWHPDGQTLTEMVPDLSAIVGRRTDWRTVVLCDEGGLELRNPFERVCFEAPERGKDESDREYMLRLREAKFRAYDKAVQMPLTRLMTFLCQMPIISSGDEEEEQDEQTEEPGDDIELSRKSADERFRLMRAEHRAEAAHKQACRRQIIGDQSVDFVLPKEIYCIAKRTFFEQESDIRSSWATHVDYQYSRFYDWNLYFDRMRYLIYDILPQSHQGYTYNYLEFLYAALLIAGNELPPGSLRSDRVYRLECENDENALRRLIVSYDAKLRATEDRLNAEMNGIATAERPQLTNEEVAANFCTPVRVPVTFDEYADTSGLYADKKEFGLSYDCPSDGELAWETTFGRAEGGVHKLMKQPRRSLKRAVADFHVTSFAYTERAEYLDAFQMEDVEEFVDREQSDLVDIQTVDLYDAAPFHKRMKKEDEAIRAELNKRLTRKMALGFGASMLLMFLIGLLPLLAANNDDSVALAPVLLLMGAAIALVALGGVVCLVCLRSGLKKSLEHFNGVMKDIVDQLQNAMTQFSHYLTGVGSVKRGMAALSYYREHEHSDVLQIRIRKKHMQDVERCRQELQGVFGAYLTDDSFADPSLTEPYDHDFSRSVDFGYPVPYTEGTERTIEFMQPGYDVTVPVDFIKRIKVEVEGLYE